MSIECMQGTFLFIALKKALISDLEKLGICCSDFELELRPYSKNYYGRYYTNRELVVVYVYRDKEKTTPFDYSDIFSTVLHEVCHHLQWSNPEWVRLKGVMHDKAFWDMWTKYMKAHRDSIKDPERREVYDKFIINRGRKNS